jgi:hypothetical protein
VLQSTGLSGLTQHTPRQALANALQKTHGLQRPTAPRAGTNSFPSLP